MAREVVSSRIYESPALGSRSITSSSQPSTTTPSSRPPLGLSLSQPQAQSLSLAKTILLGKKTLASSANPKKKRSSGGLGSSRKPGKEVKLSKENTLAAAWEEDSDEDDGGFGNLTRESSKNLPGSATKGLSKTIGRPRMQAGGGGGERKSDGPKARSEGGKGTSAVAKDVPGRAEPRHSNSTTVLSVVSTTPTHPPPSSMMSRRAPSLPAPASPSSSLLFPSARRATSQAPPPKSPLKSLIISRSRKRTISSGLSTTTPVASPNPRAKKQPKSSALSASASLPTSFALSTPVAVAGSSKRPHPRTDRPVASKPTFPFISASQPNNLTATSRKKSTLSQSTTSTYNRRRSAPARGLSVTIDVPDEGTELGSVTLPDTPPPPRSPGDDPILLKGKERVRRYVHEEGDESVLMGAGDDNGMDELDLMMSQKGSRREKSVKAEEEHEQGNLSMKTSTGGGAEEDEDENEDVNIIYNPQASPSTSRPRSSLVTGPLSSPQRALLPLGSLARPSPLPLLLTSSAAHSTPLMQRTSSSSLASTSSLSHQPTPIPQIAATSSNLDPYTPAPALSPYTFHQPGTPESYSGSEDDREERVFNRERSDSFLAGMQGGTDDEEGWAKKIRSSLSPDSSDRDDFGEAGNWGDDEGDLINFGRDDGAEEETRREKREKTAEQELAAVVDAEEMIDLVSGQPVETEEEQEEQAVVSSQPRPSLANLDRSSPVPIPEQEDHQEQEEPVFQQPSELVQDAKEPSAAPEDASPPSHHEDDVDEQEQDQDSSFFVMVEQKSLADEIAEVETPDLRPAEVGKTFSLRGDDGENSFSEGDYEEGAQGFESDSVGGSQQDQEEAVEEWKNENGDAMEEEVGEQEEELYFNESSQDLLDAAEHSFFSTITSPSPIKSVHMSSPSKFDRHNLQPVPAVSSTPSRAGRAIAASPFTSSLPTILASVDITTDYVVELNDVSEDEETSVQVEHETTNDLSIASTTSSFATDSPSVRRLSLDPKRLSIQSFGQLDAIFRNRAASVFPSNGEGSPPPSLAAFPSTSTSTYFPVTSSSSIAPTITSASSHSYRRPSVSSSTGGAYPSISDVMAAKQEILSKAFAHRASSSQAATEDVLKVGASEGDEEEGDTTNVEETYIKISSNDPREAARVTAILKMLHDYDELDLNNPNSSFTSAASSSSRRKSALPARPPLSRRRSSLHMCDVSMMSAPELLMEAEQEIADELDASFVQTHNDEEEEEELAIPGSFQSSSMLSNMAERSFEAEQKLKARGKGRATSLRDGAWGTSEWRCLMECLDAVGGKKGEVEEDVVVGRFLDTMGLEEDELEGEWDRSKLLIRIASIQQRRLNELKSPSRRRRSHNPHKALLSPNKAANLSVGSISSNISRRSPVPKARLGRKELAAPKPTLAGKLFGFLSGGWLASPAPVPPAPAVKPRQHRFDPARPSRPAPVPVPTSSRRSKMIEVAPRPLIVNPAVSPSLRPIPPPPVLAPPTPPTPIPIRSAPITIPARPEAARANIRPRSSNARSPPPKVLELVRSFESVRSLGEEEAERVRRLERRGSQGSMKE